MEAIAGPRYLAVAPCSREQKVRLRSAFPAAPCRRVRFLTGHQQHSAAPLGPSSTVQTPQATSLLFSLSRHANNTRNLLRKQLTLHILPHTHTLACSPSQPSTSLLPSPPTCRPSHTHTPCPWPDTTAPGTSIWFGNGMAWFKIHVHESTQSPCHGTDIRWMRT
jgi:hypothetical protein